MDEENKGKVLNFTAAKASKTKAQASQKPEQRFGDIFNYFCSECEGEDFNMVGIEDFSEEQEDYEVIKLVCSNEQCNSSVVGSFVWYLNEDDGEE